jgi:hypothetical protein
VEDNRKFLRRNILWRWDGEEAKHILVGVPKTRSAHLFNPTGAKIFYLCDGEHTVENIIEILKTEFPQATDRLQNDVLSFIEYLVSLDVVFKST